MDLFLIFYLIHSIRNTKKLHVKKKLQPMAYFETTYNNIIKNSEDKQDCRHQKDLKINKFKNFIKAWKEYIFVDEYTFEYDVSEMYIKYNCHLVEEEENGKCENEDIFNIETFNFISTLHENNLIFKKIYKLQKTNFDILENYKRKLLDKTENYNMIKNYTKKNFIFQTALTPEFIQLFCILENDFLSLIENVQKYIYMNNTYFQNITKKYKTLQKPEDKLRYFININLKLIKTFIKDNEFNSSDKKTFLRSILSSLYSHKKPVKTLNNKLYCKRILFKLALYNKKLTYTEILQYCIYIINKLTNKSLQMLCVIGAGNLFVNDLIVSIPRYISILIILYTFANERDHYDIEWTKMITKMFICSRQIKNSRYFEVFLNMILREENPNSNYQVYIFLNSNDIFLNLEHYNTMSKNIDNLQFLNFLIDLINMTKCKLLGILLN